MTHLLKRIVIGIAILLGMIYLVGGSWMAYDNYSLTFKRNPADEGPFAKHLQYKDIDPQLYPCDTIHFASGDNMLTGFIYGTHNNKGLVVIAHGLGDYSAIYFMFTKFFVDHGFRVLVYDCTGSGISQGNSTRGLYQSAIDLDHALSFVESNPALRNLPVNLLGHSWGGYAVCAVLNHPHRIHAVVSLAGYNNGMEMLAEEGKRIVGWKYDLLYPHIWVMQKLMFGSHMHLTAIDGINAKPVPVMIVQGSNDQKVSTDGASIYAHRSEIINPNVEYVLMDSTYNDGHSTLFASKAAIDYRQKAKAVMPQADANMSPKELSTLRAKWATEYKFDKPLYNQLNPVLMNKILAFFESQK